MAAYGRIFEPYAPKWDYDQFGQRSRVPLWDIYNGCILWLPPRDEINSAALVSVTTLRIVFGIICSPSLYCRIYPLVEETYQRIITPTL